MNRMSDCLIIDREEAELLSKAWSDWWIPRIKTEKDKKKLMEYDKMAKTLRYFLQEELESTKISCSHLS